MAESVFHEGDLQGQIDSLSDQIGNRVKYHDATSSSVTVNANGRLAFSIDLGQYEGKNACGVVSIDFNGNEPLLISKYSLYSNIVYISVYNPTGSAVTTTFTVRGLYF